MSETTKRVLINGAFGRMGRTLIDLHKEDPMDLQIVAGVIEYSPLQRAIGSVAYYAAEELPGVPAFDVAIDFSLADAFDAILALCLERRVALVSGTTGLSEAQKATIEKAGESIPIVWASNFSLGVAVLADLVERAAGALPGWDCDIIESHHAQKVDAPSGTALSLGEAAMRGQAQPRYASLRAGDIVGEHLVQFTGLGERVELVHRATNRDIFARGALHVASRLVGKPAGVYRVRDLL